MDEKKRAKLREAIRKRIQKELDEMSTTAGAGPYLTPNAFVGDKHSNAGHIKKVAALTGYSVAPGTEKTIKPGDRLNEDHYYEYRNDPTKKPHQKIGTAIAEVNRQFKLIERAIRMNRRLQKECGVSNNQLWKRTTNQMLKLEGKLIELAARLRDMRG